MPIELKLRSSVASFITVEQARKAMWKALQEDSELAETYIAVIEGTLIDTVPRMNNDRMLSGRVAQSIYIALYREEDEKEK